MGKAALFLSFALGVVLGAGSNPFGPKTETPPEDTVGGGGPAPLATTPEQVVANLERAFQDRDKDLYETLLDIGFWFTETDCNGELIFSNDLEVELEIMGSRDGSSRGIFDIFRTVEFDFTLPEDGRKQEFGFEYPKAFETDPDGHPDEDWEVFEGRVQILLLENDNDGFRVDQTMTYKMRLLSQEELQDSEIVPELTDAERTELAANNQSIWRMRRWDDNALAGGNDCVDIETEETSKPISGIKTIPWSALKAHLQ